MPVTPSAQTLRNTPARGTMPHPREVLARTARRDPAPEPPDQARLERAALDPSHHAAVQVVTAICDKVLAEYPLLLQADVLDAIGGYVGTEVADGMKRRMSLYMQTREFFPLRRAESDLPYPPVLARAARGVL